ncbi:VID27-like protein, partial [Cyclospora cayetanensis]|uniref:VID27-like protein n=1 Tax=Cyclospora cayetanensis TaxID=88456 RepID=A0A6P6RX46_9EIME
DLLRSTSNSMVNEMLEAGAQRAVVFRVGSSPSQGRKRDMQVLRFDAEGQPSVVATIDGSKLNLQGKPIQPSAAMLHSCEERLILLDEASSSSSSAYPLLFDLETQRITDRISVDAQLEHILPATSESKGLSDPTFIGLNSKAFFCIDTRVKGGSARKHSYTYSQNQGFSCGATNAEGHLVLGSGKGVLRLYDGKTNSEGSFKRAKTQLNAFGDPILHIAVTKDGAWILATCARYLLLYPVRLQGSAKTGFTSPLGALKPKPILLRLSLEDVSRFNLQTCAFKTAVFDAKEQHIVTSTNNLVIIWDFVAVKNGKTDAYQIRRISDYIKDLAFFEAGDREAVLMVTPCSITTRGVRRVYQDCESEPEA